MTIIVTIVISVLACNHTRSTIVAAPMPALKQRATNSTVSGLFNQLKTSAFGGANEIGVERRERQVSSHGEFEICRVI